MIIIFFYKNGINEMEKISCFHFKNFNPKKMTKDIVIMILIIIHNYSNK